LTWIAPTPPAYCSINSYTVYGGTTANPTTVIASGVTTPSYTDTGLAATTTYYFVVKAVDADGTSAASAQAIATTEAAGSVSINSGGPAVSNVSGGDNSFVADEYYSAAETTYSTTNAITIPASISTTAAPMAVYQTAGQGVVTYTVPGLTTGINYIVRLHFAELYFTATGSRVFNVAINGTSVLTNFDVVAASGAQYTALVEQFTTTPNSSGNIVIAFTAVTDQPMINGIEVFGAANACTTVPSAPTNLTATASSSSAIALSWTAVTPPANCSIGGYNVYGGTTANPTTLLASVTSGTTYTNTGLTASTLYYYVVKAVDAEGASAAASAQATTSAASTCNAVPPTGPTSLTATTVSSSSISLSWPAGFANPPCTVTSYNVFRSTTNGFAPGSGNLIASGVTSTSYTNTGLAASTTYYYLVETLDSYGASAASPQAQATTTGGTCSAVPPAPTGLTATASSSSAIGLSWTAPTAPSNCTISSYTVYGGTTTNPTTAIASGLTSTSYTNSGLAASTTYYYLVKAVDAYGTSAASSQASATTQAVTLKDYVSINAGGAAVSNSGGGDNSFVADEYYSGGSTYSVTSTITIPSSVSATAAPAAVYKTEREGVSTYTITGLTSGTSYTVRLHFAELYFSASGGRDFNVAINGTTVLTNFDIYATAGAKNTAVVENFTATANSSGQIVIAFTNGAKDQPQVNGIEVL
jgi:fibronectin type 3 domain-containing protein